MDIFTTFLDSYFLILSQHKSVSIVVVYLILSYQSLQSQHKQTSNILPEHHSTIAKVSAREATRDAPLFEEYAISYSAERLLGIA
jgi:hypothetical protein